MSVICLVRHGDRLDTNNYEEWRNSPRYKENTFGFGGDVNFWFFKDRIIEIEKTY